MKRQAPNKIRWTRKMIRFLKDNYSGMTNQQLADGLGLKLTSVRTKLYELGLKRMELEYWTPEQVQYLLDNYRNIGDHELADIYQRRWPKRKGWSPKHIEKKRRYLNLKRTKQEKLNILERNKKRGVYLQGVRKMWKTRGAREIDAEVTWDINGYPTRYVKTASGYRKLAHLVWEKLHGPMPKGGVLIHKDGDQLNCDPGNLELITRAELSKRNHNARKISQSLKKTYEMERIRMAYGLPVKTKTFKNKLAKRGKKDVKAIIEEPNKYITF